jgi:hypothetical protein
MAPISLWLPSTAFGARLIPAMLGLCMVGLFVVLLRHIFANRTSMLALLLICVPSAYVLTLQSAYSIPQYTMSGIWYALLPLLAARALSTQECLLVVATGLACGLALSNHLLTLPIVALVATALCIGRSPRAAVKQTVLVVPSMLCGLIPYLLTWSQAQATASSVTGTYPITVALKRFFLP